MELKSIALICHIRSLKELGVQRSCVQQEANYETIQWKNLFGEGRLPAVD
jgi:hypothetical protein